jgi:hypothetical protein
MVLVGGGSLGVDEVLEVAGEGGGGEPAEVVSDGDGVGSSPEVDGPAVRVPPGRVGVVVGVDCLDGECWWAAAAAGLAGRPAAR